MDEGAEAVRMLRAEVKVLRAQVGALISREHERDLVDRLIAGAAVPHGHRSAGRPALWVVSGTG